MSTRRRKLIRATDLSVVERVRLAGSGPETAVLKIVIPELRYEYAAHKTVEMFDITATTLLAANPDATFPRLLMRDVSLAGETGENQEPGLEEIGCALEMLAEVHAAYSSGGSLPAGLPDCSVGALLSPEQALIQLIQQVFEESHETLSPESVDEFLQGIESVRDVLKPLPLTLVHGDFDPGNLVFSRGKWRALDWGLAHLNVPFVDVAQMVMRFEPDDRAALTERYAEAARDAGLLLAETGDLEALVQAANVAHMAFFVWWHSHCIVSLGSRLESLFPTIKSRFEQIAAYRSGEDAMRKSL